MSRLTRLENAHRALAAQHTALLEVCRALLPLVPAPREFLRQVLAGARGRNDACMAAAAMDAEHQASIQRWLDILANEVTEGAAVTHARPLCNCKNERQTTPHQGEAPRSAQGHRSTSQ
jgi:hypothetical protein